MSEKPPLIGIFGYRNGLACQRFVNETRQSADERARSAAVIEQLDAKRRSLNRTLGELLEPPPMPAVEAVAVSGADNAVRSYQ